jgi:hypothetical protein
VRRHQRQGWPADAAGRRLRPRVHADLNAVRRVRGVAIAIAAAALCVVCFLPSFRLAIEAFIGGGAEQRGFRYERDVSIVPDSGVAGVAVLALGVALVVLGILGGVRGFAVWSSAAAFGLALVFLLLVFDTEDRRLGWPGPHGVIGHEESSAGPLLDRPFDELKRAARRSPEGAEPGWTLSGGEHGYAARGQLGWHVFFWSTLSLCWLTGYGLARLRLGPWVSALIVLFATGWILVWLVLRGLAGD